MPPYTRYVDTPASCRSATANRTLPSVAPKEQVLVPHCVPETAMVAAGSGLPGAISASGRTNDASAAALARRSADGLVRPVRLGPPMANLLLALEYPGFGACYRSQ